MPKHNEKTPVVERPVDRPNRPEPKVDLGPDDGGMWEKRNGTHGGVETR